MAKTTKEKLWNAWALDNVEDLQSWSAAGVIGMATLGGWCGNEVPRLKSTGGMTMELALKLLPTLRSTSVAGIYRAVEESAKAIPGDDLLDYELLLMILRARDLLLDHRDAMARTLRNAQAEAQAKRKAVKTNAMDAWELAVKTVTERARALP